MTTATENLLALFKLRLAVAALGEKHQWWTTSCCNAKRTVVFKQLFPTTWELASVCAVSEAAKLVHSAALANRSQHLFRFNTELEQDLHGLLTHDNIGKTLFQDMIQDPEGPEKILLELAEKGVHPREGAISMGPSTRETIEASIPKMAGLYQAAFRSGIRCVPYFEPEQI